jgi:hypothetical protein
VGGSRAGLLHSAAARPEDLAVPPPRHRHGGEVPYIAYAQQVVFSTAQSRTSVGAGEGEARPPVIGWLSLQCAIPSNPDRAALHTDRKQRLLQNLSDRLPCSAWRPGPISSSGDVPNMLLLLQCNSAVQQCSSAARSQRSGSGREAVSDRGRGSGPPS